MLGVGVFACSTAVIMVKVTQTSPLLLAGQRLLIAAAALTPFLLGDLRRLNVRLEWGLVRRTLLPGLMLGAHFITWILGARLTRAAHASLIVNMVPIAMPFLLHWMIRERLTRGEWVGTVIAITGVGILAGGDYRLSPELFLGDVVCFGSMLLFACYLALARRNRDFPSIWIYLVPLYVVGGLACFGAAGAAAVAWELPGGRGILSAMGIGEVHPLVVPRSVDWALAVALGLVPTVIGHSTLNNSMRYLGGQAVSIANLGQFIFAGTMAYFLLAEVPKAGFYPAAALVIVGAVGALRATPPTSDVEPTGRFAPPRSES
jgi:drug/metabolite transporter (DMT)-like permease